MGLYSLTLSYARQHAAALGRRRLGIKLLEWAKGTVQYMYSEHAYFRTASQKIGAVSLDFAQ